MKAFSTDIKFTHTRVVLFEACFLEVSPKMERLIPRGAKCMWSRVDVLWIGSDRAINE